MSSATKTTVMYFLAVIFICAGCGGGGGDGGGTPPAPTPTTCDCIDITGTWNTYESFGTTTCDTSVIDTAWTKRYVITQSCCTLTVQSYNSTGFFEGTNTGSIDSNRKLSWSGSWADYGGTVNVNYLNIFVDADGNRLATSSQADFTFSNPSPYTCKGVVNVTGTRDPASYRPEEPTDLTATATSATAVRLTWVARASNESGFKIERSLASSSGFTQIAIAAANATSYTDTLLSPATTYYYKIRAYNAAGDSDYTTVANALTPSAPPNVPAAPTDLTAAATSATAIRLTWVDHASNESGFKIERSLASSSGFTQIAIAAANATSYTDTSLSSATTYYYRVIAYNADGDSSYTPVANAITPTSKSEPNNSPGTADPITATAPIVGTVTANEGNTVITVMVIDDSGSIVTVRPTVEDWYQFSLSAQQTVTITMNFTGSTTADLDLFLMNSTASVLYGYSVHDNVARNNQTETITISLAAGSYRIGVDGFSTPSGPIEYILTFR